MTKNTYLISAVALVIISLGIYAMFAQQSQKTAEDTLEKTTDEQADAQAEALVDGTFTVQPSDSAVTWEGRKTLIADYVDVGTLEIKEGSFTVADKTITAGSVTFDMTTITATATAKNSGQDALSNHLKSDAFFDVVAYPTATFTVTAVTPATDAATSFAYTITGDLTMKAATHEISFPGIVYMKNGEAHLEASATVDRTKWDVRFGSDNFFDNLGNNVIDDNFTVAFHLVARP